MFAELRRRLRVWFDRERLEREMSEELEVFLDLDAAERERAGVASERARRATMLEMGGLEQVKEALREQHPGVFLDILRQDVRYGLRMLLRRPGFTIVAVLTLAMGIGANTAIFSVVQSVLLAPLPFADSERLVRLMSTVTQANGQQVQGGASPLYFHRIREASRLLESVAAQRYQNLTLVGDGEPERVVGIGVSDGWLQTLGVRPVLGRGFDASEQKSGSASHVLLLSHAFWRRRFGGDRGALGRSVQLDEETYEIIGVMPSSFRYPYNTDLWLPQTFSPSVARPGDLNVVGRMKPGVTYEQLREEMNAIATRLRGEVLEAANVGIEARPFRQEFRRDPKRSIAALLVAVGFVLLIACVNAANLLLARGVARIPEVAVRVALGAARGRLVRQWITENTLLALVGGFVGIAVASWSSQSLAVLIPSRLGEVIQDVRTNGSLLALSFLLCLATGLFVSLVPAVRASGQDPIGALNEGRRSSSSRSGRIFQVLVVAQVALAVALLAAAASVAQNFGRLLAADVGYDAKNLLRIQLSLSQPAYQDPLRRAALMRRVEERVGAVAGVVAAGLTTLQPIPRTTTNTGTRLALERRPDPTKPLPIVNMRLVTPSYFKTMGMRIVRGRGFSPRDTDTAVPVLVVSEAAARRFWPGQDPVGQRAKPGRFEDATVAWHTVVGVVSDVAEPEDEITETIYRAYEQGAASLTPGTWSTTSVSLMVRTAGESGDVASRIRSAVREIDGTLPLYEVSTMEAALAVPLSDQRLGTLLFMGFSAFGLAMAVLGTYGVIAFSVRQRTREFGMRLALGARPGALQRMVMREGLKLVATGILLGATGALGLSRWLARVLTEVDPRDPLMLTSVAMALLVAGLLACAIPARRASRVDPIAGLRYE